MVHVVKERRIDNGQFINAVFWILRTGAPWRDLLPEYGCWSNTHRHFKADMRGIIGETRLRLMESHTKVYRHTAEAKGNNQEMSRLNTKIHLAMDAHGIPVVRVLVTDGTTADCTQASKLIERISAEYLLADIQVMIVMKL